jgi:hypothetical protein
MCRSISSSCHVHLIDVDTAPYSSPEAGAAFPRLGQLTLNRKSVACRAVLDQETIHIWDDRHFNNALQSNQSFKSS